MNLFNQLSLNVFFVFIQFGMLLVIYEYLTLPILKIEVNHNIVLGLAIFHFIANLIVHIVSMIVGLLIYKSFTDKKDGK